MARHDCEDLFKKIENCNNKISKLEQEREDAKKAFNEKISAVADLREAFKRDIVARVTGKQAKDCAVGDRAYGATSTNSDFHRWPPNAIQPLRNEISYAELQLRRTHPVGHALEQLGDRVQYYEDQLLACNSHTALQAIWDAVVEELGDFDPDALTKRQPRRVKTGRNGKGKAEKVEEPEGSAAR